MISLNNISKQYSGTYLFKNVSLHNGDRERIALVGSNGAGKSTLMQIMMSLIEPDSGEIVQCRSNTVGYLPQEGVYHRGKTLFDEVVTAFDDVLLLRERMDHIHQEIECATIKNNPDGAGLSELLQELGKIQHHLEHRNNYGIEARVKQVLSGLGFSTKDFGCMTDEFSGGWQTRIELAKLLLREPTILLLDEPTNHLDLPSLQWLEAYLRAYEGSVVLVSHDRRFLDNMVERIVEISRGTLTEFSGNYSYYLREKNQHRAALRAAYQNQQRHIKQTREFVQQFRYKATKARQVQSRLKALEKMSSIEIPKDENTMAFKFPLPQTSGRVVMELRHIVKSYGTRTVFKGLSLKIERGDKIALVGVNGSGKSTLARIIAGIEPVQSGERIPGHKVAISYFAQHQAEELNPHQTVLQEVEKVAPGESATHLRSVLGAFLFSGDEVFKKAGILSGGEKNRLALAKMLLTGANFLILDEPTNHLDMASKKILQRALWEFAGSCLIVSPDRDFLSPIINTVIDISNGSVNILRGSIDDYLNKLYGQQQTAAIQPCGTTGNLIHKKRAQHLARIRRRHEAGQRQERYRMIQPLKIELQRLKEQICQAEDIKVKLETALADPATYAHAEQARATQVSYQEIQSRLALLYKEWEAVYEQIEKIESGAGIVNRDS